MAEFITGFIPVFSVVLSLCMEYVSGGEGLRIEELRMPEVVQNGTDPVVLDCDYVLDSPPKPSGVVVKWYFNNHPAPVYQWIFSKKPQVMGVLKGKVNLGYRASNEASTMYRAIEIPTPTIELSGEYKCTVSTFDIEVSKSKKMIVYVPEKSLQLNTVQTKDKKVTATCSAEGVFPEPNMTILAVDSNKPGDNNVTTRKQVNSSLFDIEGFLTMNDADLATPTTFTCELTIQDTHYNNRKETAYFPGPPTTTPVHEDVADERLQTSGGNGSMRTIPLLSLFVISIYLGRCWSSL